MIIFKEIRKGLFKRLSKQEQEDLAFRIYRKLKDENIFVKYDIK